MIAKQKHGQPWVNEAGTPIPFDMIKPLDKVNEKVTFDIAQKAIKASEMLATLKQFIGLKIGEAIKAFHIQYKGKRTDFAGNYTFYNYNHTIKVEVSVNSPVRFDDMLIAEAQTLLKKFLDAGVNAKSAAIKSMVMSAFETSRKKLDTKKILGLKRYTKEIGDPLYTRAMNLIDEAIRRPETATYYKVYVKGKGNVWEFIPLALSDIK